MNAIHPMSLGLRLVWFGLLGACSSSVDVSPTIVIPPLPPAPVTEDVSALGVISALGSVTVNGVVYQTNSTSVTVNGETATFSDLQLGQIVSLEGMIEVSGSRGTASRVDYEATVIGPVESLDASLGQLVVMGQSVLTNADTVFDQSIDPSTFAGLAVGSNAQVSGFLNSTGEIVATLVEPDTASTSMQVIGRVAGLDTANMLFSVNRLTVDYGSATLVDLPGGMPADGMFVIAKGSIADGILDVSQISELYDLDGGTPGERAQAQGMITRFASATDFDLNGVPMTTDGSTVFVNGTINDLQANAEVTIDGEIAANGNSILANEIAFGRVVSPTTKVTFELENFSDIAVSGVFNVVVTQSPDFLVEVTIDSDDVDRLDVTQDGSTLNIGLLQGTDDANIETISAVVTLPVLNAVDLDGVINVELHDFTQSELSVDVGGVSRLRSDSLMIGELTAIVSGVSQLDLADIRPLGSAGINVSGVSTATLNMNVGSSMTGSVTGPSSLFYYGTNVMVDVTSEAVSSVTKLGETRP